MSAQQLISRIEITPVAFHDPPLLNTVGVHEPFALRAIIQIHTSDGLVGLGETYADAVHVGRLTAVADQIIGVDVYSLGELRNIVVSALAKLGPLAGGDGVAGMITTSSTIDRVFSPFEVACLDIIGKSTGRPVVDILGGKVRESIPYSAYLFYKWENHPDNPNAADHWGEALTPEQIVQQARRMVGEFGFSAIKLKGGVFPPEEEVAAILALREAFPDHPLRLDPNAAWTVETSVRVARQLEGVVEYLEDPTPGIAGMAEVARNIGTPLATNMAVVSFADLEPAIRQRAVGVVLSDHHFWGGLTQSKLLGGICETFSLGLSMHSNSHLGISLAAMTHLAGATGNLNYACDTHWPWKTEDVIKPSILNFVDGSVRVPDAPGLGVELDQDALAALHENYLECGQTKRDDTDYMQRYFPKFERKSASW